MGGETVAKRNRTGTILVPFPSGKWIEMSEGRGEQKSPQAALPAETFESQKIYAFWFSVQTLKLCS
jgi:hypothetical protein